MWPTSDWANKPLWTKSAAGQYGQKCECSCAANQGIEKTTLMSINDHALRGEGFTYATWSVQFNETSSTCPFGAS